MTGSKDRFLRIEVDASGPIHIHLATDGRGHDPVITLERADAAALAAALLPVVSDFKTPKPVIYKDGLLHLNVNSVAEIRDENIVARVADIEARLVKMYAPGGLFTLVKAIDDRLARIERWREGE